MTSKKSGQSNVGQRKHGTWNLLRGDVDAQTESALSVLGDELKSHNGRREAVTRQAALLEVVMGGIVDYVAQELKSGTSLEELKILREYPRFVNAFRYLVNDLDRIYGVKREAKYAGVVERIEELGSKND